MLEVDRDAVLASVDLRTLADELLTRRSDSSGGSVWACPNADHRAANAGTNEVTFYTTRRGEQRWCCLGCGSGRTAIDLVMKARGTGYVDSLRYLADHVPRHPPLVERAATEATHPVQGLRQANRSGLDAWAAHAAELLWQPHGQPVRHWLTRTRCVPEDVLRINRIGATTVTPDAMLPTRRAAPGHRSSASAAVLPVIAKDHAIYAQLRPIDPQPAEAPQPGEATDESAQLATVASHGTPMAVEQAHHLNNEIGRNRRQLRYIAIAGTTGNPRVGLYRPARRLHPEILVTEGILDALAANAAGYRAAAVLSPGLADAEVAVHLSRLQGPLVLALDPDDAGQRATDRLMHHLTARGRHPARLEAMAGDLNEALVESHDWPRKLVAHVRHAVAFGHADALPSL